MSNSDSNTEIASVNRTPSKTNKTAECIRQTGNWSKIRGYHLFDKKSFIKESILSEINESSPKLVALFDKIKELDKLDIKRHGKLFKHMIFTDVSNSTYSSKILASAFIAYDFNITFEPTKTAFKMKDTEELFQTQNNNFGMLVSKPLYNRGMKMKFKQEMMNLYNERPENIHGKLMRFIILDQGFKEGIDLFDVKYIHLFEPLVVRADEKQAIGRGTRFCGQKGLDFHPKFGWPLYVFRYEVGIPEILHDRLNAKQLLELYLSYTSIDLRRIVFASEIENASQNSAVDKSLTSSIHQFKVDIPPPVLDDLRSVDKSIGGAVTRTARFPPGKIMNLNEMQSYIKQKFTKFTYPKVKLENNCIPKGGNNGNIVQFTQTQDFIRHFFQPESAYKGMLLWHSVGTGKTCTAIATASTSFEKQGYTILWVTRHTLKNDIWKNMFGQVCSLTMQEKILSKSLKLPNKISGPMKYMPPNWMEPISYKTFSNMLLKKNKVYDDIVKRNGAKDPLHKTLLIIDEAHKLYAPGVAASEKPDTKILEQMIQNSYNQSGDDSVRVLLMTATPYTEDAMELVNLLNLLRLKKNMFPVKFEDFSKSYLDVNGYFTNPGKDKFMNETSGYISYLNRSQDARNFAHPILKDVIVKLSLSYPEKRDDLSKEEGKLLKINKFTAHTKELKKHKKEMAAELKDKIKTLENNIKIKCKGEKSTILLKCKDDILSNSKILLEKLEYEKNNIKINKSNDDKKCQELKSAADKTVCKEKNKEKYTLELEILKDKINKHKLETKFKIGECSEKTKDYSSECKNNIKIGKTKMLADIDVIIAKIKENKSNYTKLNEKRKEYGLLIKNDRIKKKTLGKDVKSLKNQIKTLKKNKEDKSNKLAKLKEIRGEMKLLINQKNDLRDSIIKNKKLKDFISEEIGTKLKADTSQETALFEKCKL